MPSERAKKLTLILCCLAQFMVVLDVSIVNVALPSIRSDLRFTPTELQWIVNAYTLTFAGFLLLGGRAADLLGRRRVFMAGMLLFALASLVGGLAQDRLTLVVARAIQGLGGAVVAPATLSILATTFTDRAERNKALGLWGAMGGVGGATGGLLGGALTQTLNWRWVLFINLPIGLLATFAAWRVVAEGRSERPGRHFDVAGAITVTAGLVILTYGIVGTEVHGWASATTLITLAAGLVLLSVFLYIEARVAAEPLMPLRIFRSLPLSAANLVVFALGSSVFAMWYFATLYMQNVLGYSPLRAGFAFLPMTLLIVVCSRIAGPLVSRRGPWGMLATGMTMIAVGLALFSRISADGTYLADVLAPSLLCAAGIGFSFVPVTIAATAGVDASESGLASGLVNTSRQVGGSLGLAILATLATARTADPAGRAGAGGRRLDRPSAPSLPTGARSMLRFMQTQMDAGSVIGRAFTIYKEQAGVLLPIAFGLFVVVGVLGALASTTLFLLPIYFVITIIAHTLFQGMVIALVSDVQDGRRDFSAGQLIQSVVPVVVPLFLAALVAGVITLIAFITIIGGFFLVTAWFVIAPVIVVERTGPIAALGRSWQLVKTHFWQVFLTIFLLFLIVFVTSFVLGIIGAIAGDVGRIIVNVLASAITAPIWALTATVTYFALRGDAQAEVTPAAPSVVTPETSATAPPPPPPPQP